MQSTPSVILACILTGLIGLAGCKDAAEKISSADHLLSRQHKACADDLETLRSDQPNYNLVRAAGGRFRRTLRRVEKDYTGSNKHEVIAKLNLLADRFDAEVAPKLTMASPEVRLQTGVTAEELRTAFESLQADFETLKDLTSGG